MSIGVLDFASITCKRSSHFVTFRYIRALIALHLLALILFQRLLLLAGAAERCKTVRVLDVPPSASEPVVQLRVLGDFSITSDDGDDQDNCEENEASGSV
jgi:hypothetical protein